MSFPSMLYSFILMPIQLVFELVFSYAYHFTGEQAGLAIILLSLAFNLLVLPLYRRADAMQEEERNIEAKLHDGVDHIKKTFRGNERTMMLQTYYRQNNYSPLRVLRSAVSLLLQIPFFIAAYRFLSGLDLLQGVSFGPIADLSRPDAIIAIGGITINALPILMTAINMLSTIILTKGYPLKTKIQLYALAAFFLVFLYNSPSGLVFYWVLNNLFALGKTVFYKYKNSKSVFRVILLVIGCGLIGFGFYSYIQNTSIVRTITFLICGLMLTVPFIYHLIKSKTSFSGFSVKAKPDKKLFWCGAAFLAILTGILIPSAVISSSPQEFIVVGSNIHPVWYIISTFLISSGMFILWMGIFYWLFTPKAKVILERLILITCGCAIINYLFFGNDFGTLSAELIYHSDIYYGLKHMIKNGLILIAVAIVLLVITKKKAVITKSLVLVSSVAMVVMAVVNMVGIFNSVAKVDTDISSITDDRPHITLSKTQDNIVVLMLDRAMGEYVPYIMSEHPELKEKFSGFTYYSNVISFGGHTIYGTPPLFGGYEYTPTEINKRDTESLVSKHNEALKVMPVLFDNAGYDVTVCDPPYAGYQEIPDLSIYDDYPDIKKYNTQGSVSSDDNRAEMINNRFRNFFCYSITKVSPICLQSTLYENGRYHQVESNSNYEFGKSYDVLKQLSAITSIEEKDKGCFVMMKNDTTHNAVTFEDDQFLEPCSEKMDHYNKSITLNEISLNLDTYRQMGGYQTNVAALMRLSEWFDYLKEQGVYDNTRIVIVADHGSGLNQIEGFDIDETAYSERVDQRIGDAEFYYPLLMVKDFNGSEFTTSDEFMTNADVPFIATKGLFDSPINPFTGKEIDNNKKTAREQRIIATDSFQIPNGNTFPSSRWYSVHDSIWDKKTGRYLPIMMFSLRNV